MKRIVPIIILLMMLTACATPQTQGMPESATTDIPQANMSNPASVYCAQNGNKHEIVTAADGSSCDEWAYYRGECGPATQKSPTPAATTGENGSGGYMPPGTSEEISDWWGLIKSTEPGA